MIGELSAKDLEVDGNLAARERDQGRRADSSLERDILGWDPHVSLADRFRMLYAWLEQRLDGLRAIEKAA